MASNSCNVLRVNTVEEQTGYRKAVSKILLNIQRDYDVTLQEIAESIDVSLGTISNAANMKTDLSPTFLNRMGRAYGAEYLSPYAALSGGRVVSINKDAGADILPLVAKVNLSIANMRCPTSPGGALETPKEQLDSLPELIKLQSKLEAKIAEIQEIAA